MIFTVSLMSNIVGNRANCLGNVMNSFRYSLTFVHLCVSPPVRGINHSLYYKRVDNLHADTDKPW